MKTIESMNYFMNFRNTMSEAGRSIDETVLHPPTHIMKDDLPINVRHYVRLNFIILMDSN